MVNPARTPPNKSTPVLVGVGQFTERLEDAGYRALSPVAITAEAGRIALDDAGITDDRIKIDTLFAIRTFEDSAPVLAFPFGRSNNFPRSICRQLGLKPSRAVWAPSGGDRPQKLVAEACELIDQGLSRAVLICGGEAMATARNLIKTGAKADWSEELNEEVEDRGAGIDYLTGDELTNGLVTPMQFHGIIENARRAKSGKTREDWRRAMGTLFAPFSKAAVDNPLSSVHERAYSAEELATPDKGNRLVVDPYTQRLIARDHVNQSAALVVVASEAADALGVPEAKRVYLHGYGSAQEKPVSLRHDVGSAPSAGLALRHAMANARVDLGDINHFDFYSCFPVAVSNAIEAIGIAADDSRGLTVTGGLPYFGGPGNNYSTHGIAEMVQRLRARPGDFGLIAANGGFLSKYAVGIYSTDPVGFETCSSDGLDREMAAIPTVTLNTEPSGSATIDAYTLSYSRSGVAHNGIVLATLEDGSRCLAKTDRDDPLTARAMADRDPIGWRVNIVAGEQGNLFALAPDQ